MRKKSDNRLIIFTFALILAIIGSFAIDSFAQGSALVRSCAGTGLTTKQAKLEVTKDGDINIIPCDARSVLLRGSVLNGSGTVQSVALSLPNIFTLSGSPITSSGTFTATLANQTQNLFFASPNGSTGTPLFRSLVAADIPNLDVAKITTGTFTTSFIPSLDAAKITTGTFTSSQIPALDVAKITTGTFTTSFIPSLDAAKITTGVLGTGRLGTGTADSTTILRGDGTWSVGTVLATNSQTGTTYTLQASDNGKVLTFNNASPITLTVPSGLGAGFNCLVLQLGAGQVTFAASSTTIYNRQSQNKTAGQYASASLVSYTANTFILSGDTN